MNMNDLAQRVAVHLPGWKPVENDNDVMGILQRSDGAQMYLRLHNNRVEVSGSYPVGRAAGSPDRSITVSPRRAPRDIAADIERRFLPQYDILYAQAAAAQQKKQRDFLWEVATNQRLASQLGAKYEAPKEASETESMRKPPSLWMDDPYLSLTFRAIAHDRSVEVARGRMPVELFERLATVIAAWLEEQPAATRPEH